VRTVRTAGGVMVAVAFALVGTIPAAAAEDGPDLDAAVVNGESVAFDTSGVVGLVPPTVRSAQVRDIFCHGALITDRIVVTAAHCVETGTPDVVLLRFERINTPEGVVEATSIGGRFAVRTAVTHPEYGARNMRNDVAVLTLDAPVASADATRLALPLDDASYTQPGATVLAAGVGCTVWSPGRGCVGRELTLRQVSLQLGSAGYCQDILDRAALGTFDPGTELCAGGQSGIGAAPDTCVGDSGTPLVAIDPTTARPVMVGVTSFGLQGCGYLPGFYTRTGGFRAWIQQQIDLSTGTGYWLVDQQGRASAFGSAPTVEVGSTTGVTVRAVWDGNRLLAVNANGSVVGSRGVVWSYPLRPGERLVTLLGTDGVTSAGRIIATDGRTAAYGDLSGLGLNAPVVDAVPTPSGRGAWLIAADGGVFALGDARFHGSTGGLVLNAPVVGMAPTSTGNGYWLVGADGGVFAFGDAEFRGSMGGRRLNAPVVGMVPDGGGYLLVAGDGGVFTYGTTPFAGSLANVRLDAPIVAIVPYAS
jgi:secreted trypsin-like serine protease